MRQYIPKINLNDHLEKYPPRGISIFHEDCLTHILHLITEIPSRSDSHETEDGYVPLNAQLLQKRIRNYNQYLSYLVSTGVLLCDNQYIKGEKSKGYKFNEDYFTKIKPVEITKFILVKSIRAAKEERIIPRKYEYLVNWFDDLTIHPAAFDYLETTFTDKSYQKAIKNATKEYNPMIHTHDWIKNTAEEEVINKYNSVVHSLDWIQNHNSFFKVDDTANRLHTALTSLNKDFRKFIYYQDKPLVAIDIVNSQPYLSIALLNPEFYNNTNDKLNIFTLNRSTTSITTISTSLPPLPPTLTSSFLSTMLVKNSETTMNCDVKRYIELCENGLIYEYLADEIYDELKIDLRGDRGELKKIVFTILYTGNQYIGQPSAAPKRIFKNRFPTVYDVSSLHKHNDKAGLAILLQKVESYLILDVICIRIKRERPDMPIYTIHDCIGTTTDNEDYLRNVMIEELTNAIGHKPTLKAEYWDIQKT